MQKKSIKYFLPVLLIGLFFISPFIMADDDSSELLSELNSWDKIVLTDTHDESIMLCIAIRPSSFEFLQQDDKRYQELLGDVKGSYLTSDESNYIFTFQARELTSNKFSTFFLSANNNSYDEWEYTAFDGENLYSILKMDPKLTDNSTDSYFSVEDKSTSPLKIMAYRIYIDNYNTVYVDLVVKNFSKKDITAFSGTFYMYDKMGHPVTWGGGNNQFGFLSQDVTIPSLSSGVNVGSWALRLYENTRKIKPLIREIRFFDGTRWKVGK